MPKSVYSFYISHHSYGPNYMSLKVPRQLRVHKEESTYCLFLVALLSTILNQSSFSWALSLLEKQNSFCLVSQGPSIHFKLKYIPVSQRHLCNLRGPQLKFPLNHLFWSFQSFFCCFWALLIVLALVSNLLLLVLLSSMQLCFLLTERSWLGPLTLNIRLLLPVFQTGTYNFTPKLFITQFNECTNNTK